MTLKHKEVVIRKPHRCFGCCQKFEAGSNMVYVAAVFDGDFGTSYWCLPCNAYLTKYSKDFEDGIGEGDLKGEPHYEEFKHKFQTHQP